MWKKSAASVTYLRPGTALVTIVPPSLRVHAGVNFDRSCPLLLSMYGTIFMASCSRHWPIRSPVPWHSRAPSSSPYGTPAIAAKITAPELPFASVYD